MAEELAGWAAQLPAFATHLNGIMDTTLGRVFEAFQAQLQSLTAGLPAGARLRVWALGFGAESGVVWPPSVLGQGVAWSGRLLFFSSWVRVCLSVAARTLR